MFKFGDHVYTVYCDTGFYFCGIVIGVFNGLHMNDYVAVESTDYKDLVLIFRPASLRLFEEE